jgi:hypothetical protein
MATKSLPSPELLRKLLDYDPETGVLTWKERPKKMFKEQRLGNAHSTWNARWAGRPALGSENSSGYCEGAILGVPVRAHRVIWAMVHGEWPAKVVDHINGNPSDNRITNLRSCSQSENGKNAKRPADNKSGVIGVHKLKGSETWVATIKANGRNFHLGRFRSLEAATAARRAAEIEHNFHPNHGRS